ncbi:hypothetical protein K7X08_035044 [Anisodus acutangulus]|uniref:Uncharacterized protein n=1 Tax=Anisodus acutangulus TaxID=402998 RepID=A0A9Q1R277_9SOLA|nr:hypothetical protein K7X08_035044 [Anisodus acutangulus]
MKEILIHEVRCLKHGKNVVLRSTLPHRWRRKNCFVYKSQGWLGVWDPKGYPMCLKEGGSRCASVRGKPTRAHLPPARSKLTGCASYDIIFSDQNSFICTVWSLKFQESQIGQISGTSTNTQFNHLFWLN